MNVHELLAAARAAQGIPSNYRLARVLDVPETTVQRWNTGRNVPGDELAARLAEMAGLDPDAVVAAMHAQRAATEGERARWQRIAQRLERGAVAACVMLSLGAFTGGPDGGALAFTAASDARPIGANPVYYVNRLARRLLALVRDAFTPASQGLTIQLA